MAMLKRKRATSSSGALQSVARAKLDETRSALQKAGPRIRARPRGGWIAAIRQALGMTVQEFAERMGVTRATAAKLEASEQRRTIQLSSLQKAADALGCDLFYALVPRQSLQEVVDQRRLEIYKSMHQRTQQHMRLEAQELTERVGHEQLIRQAERLVPDRLLWRKLD